MQVWLATNPTALATPLYDAGLQLVDPPSQARIKRFYHRADSHRCLVGRLLPRVLLNDRGFPPESIAIGATDAKKPYFATPGIDPPLGFNVSHDNELVAMAFAPDDPGAAPAFRIGVDVMKLRLPRAERFASFVHAVGDTLTDLEKRLLLAGDVPPDEALRRFYLMWTTKEAYTKALGLGLGFDFRRVECDVLANTVTVDGQPARDWEFSLFELSLDDGMYQGVTARFVGEGKGCVTVLGEDKIVRLDASSFVAKAISQLIPSGHAND